MNLLIFGTGNTADMAYYYFTNDNKYKNDYTIVGFVEENCYDNKLFHNIPVYDFSNIEDHFNITNTFFFAPISANNLNKLRERIYKEIKQKGYKMISYISSKATVLTDNIGENCFIFEDNTIQPYVTIGDNCVLWSGNHIGHHSTIGNHVFITSHVVVCGLCYIKDYSYIGVNSSIKDHLIIAENTVIGMNACVTKNTEPYNVYVGIPAKSVKVCNDSISL